MVKFTRYQLAKRGQFDRTPPPQTWDYLDPTPACPRDVAVVTCPEGHSTRLTAAVHTVDHSGRVTPSYICTGNGCSFHDSIQLVGFDSDERLRRD